MLLNCILKQTASPEEVIIVDDSDDLETKSLFHKMKNTFLCQSILLKYTRGNEKNSSISAARNVGVDHAKGNIILFADDDVTIDRRGIEQILSCYRRHPDALGVSGYISYFGQIDFFINPSSIFPNFRSFPLNSFRKVFCLPHMESGGQRILHSGHVTFPYNLAEEINVDWMSGIFSSYKTEVLKSFRFDERFGAYSLWEDVDLPARIARRYPNSLYMTPFAKAVHERSPLARRSARLLNYILAGYHTYFFFKNMPQNLRNRLAFAWSWIGMLLLRLCVRNARDLTILARAYPYTINHLNEIINGNFRFLDW
jgi:glycosyltransferase involved in cell wall biosynthesis